MQYLAEGGDRFGRHFGEHGGWGWVGGLISVLFIAGLITLLVLVVLRVSGRGFHPLQHAVAGGWAPLPVAPPVDEAVAQLRLRYARGEVGRDEYLRIAADLGAPVVAQTATPSTGPEPPSPTV
jgi:uncharacterized membrane protein